MVLLDRDDYPVVDDQTGKFSSGCQVCVPSCLIQRLDQDKYKKVCNNYSTTYSYLWYIILHKLLKKKKNYVDIKVY